MSGLNLEATTDAQTGFVSQYRTYHVYWFNSGSVYRYSSTYNNVNLVYGWLSAYDRIISDGEVVVQSTGGPITYVCRGQAHFDGNLNLKYSSNFFLIWWTGSII
jgi:hypothetical protein